MLTQDKSLSLLRGETMPYAAARNQPASLTRRSIALLVLAAAALLLTVPASLAQEKIKIVALGDSLTAGYRLAPGEGFPAVLERALHAKGYNNIVLVDAGVSGDTTSGGLSRLNWALEPGTDGVILELGANDALRGIDPAVARSNLDKMLAQIRARNLPVLLAGMLAPPNLGQAYSQSFNPIYPELAEKHGVLLYPFFLDGVTTHPHMVLEDGLHPNAKGVVRMVEGILPQVEKLIAEIEKNKKIEGGGK